MNKISDSELEVMKILWERGECTSPQIIEALSSVTDWGKTTIKTLISRLVSKGAIEQIKRDGELYIYKVAITEKEYKKSENENFITKLYKGSVNNMLLNFVEQDQVSTEDLKRIVELIEKD